MTFHCKKKQKKQNKVTAIFAFLCPLSLAALLLLFPHSSPPCPSLAPPLGAPVYSRQNWIRGEGGNVTMTHGADERARSAAALQSAPASVHACALARQLANLRKAPEKLSRGRGCIQQPRCRLKWQDTTGQTGRLLLCHLSFPFCFLFLFDSCPGMWSCAALFSTRVFAAARVLVLQVDKQGKRSVITNNTGKKSTGQLMLLDITSPPVRDGRTPARLRYARLRYATPPLVFAAVL